MTMNQHIPAKLINTAQYICYREHVTQEQDLPEDLRGLDYVCCPQTETAPTHPNYGKECGRLAFRWGEE